MSFRSFSDFQELGGGAFRRSYADEVLDDDPLAWWRLGETTGTTAADAIGSYPGTYEGSPTLGVAGAVAGNTAVTLNGASQYIRAANGSSLAFANTTFSVECWFRALVGATTQFFVAKDFGGIGNGWAVGLRATGAVGADTKGNSGAIAASRYTVATTFGDGNWHHVLAVFRTSTTVVATNDILGIIVDGVAQTITPNAGSVVYVAPTLEVEIGRRSSGNYLAGSVDEVAIYLGDRSARALAHFQAA